MPHASTDQRVKIKFLGYFVVFLCTLDIFGDRIQLLGWEKDYHFHAIELRKPSKKTRLCVGAEEDFFRLIVKPTF